MDEAIDHIISVARPKVNALLRTRGLYSQSQMFVQYKTHIWGFTEYQNGAILHACVSSLAKLDRLQSSFVHALNMTEEVAFLDHNFAPPTLRRDIGILGFLHKRVLNQCHPSVARLFPLLGSCPPYHNKQLDGHLETCIRRPDMLY